MNQLKSLFFTERKKALLASAAVCAFAFGPEAVAGTGGTEFDDIYTLLVGWTQGTLGKIIALGMFMVGLSPVSSTNLSCLLLSVLGALWRCTTAQPLSTVLLPP